MTQNDQLIVFAKNPVKGQVKRRLAAETDHETALSVYHKLLLYTNAVCRDLNCDKAVYYSHFIDNNDNWDNLRFSKYLQHGDHYGERMTEAMAKAFAAGKDRVVAIGTDCMELEAYMIKEAFAVLESNDVVVGPQRDGGYYLIGMRRFYPTLFENKAWDADNTLMDTILDLKKMNVKYYLLKTLTALNTAADMQLLARYRERPADWF